MEFFGRTRTTACLRLIPAIAMVVCDGVTVWAQNATGDATTPAANAKDQSQDDLSAKLAEIHLQAIKDRDAKDFAQVDQLRLKRLELLRNSTAVSPWTAGMKAITEADGLIKQMKYRQACERLKEAWDAFDSQPNGKAVFGDIAMKLFEAVQAAKAVYPDATAATEVSLKTLREAVRLAADADPCNVEALAADAFLTEPNPDESFQPAELRPSLRLRNKRLIDISYSKGRDKHPLPWHAPAEYLKAKSSSFVLNDMSYYKRFLDPRSRLLGLDRNNEAFSVVMGGAILLAAPDVGGTTRLCVAEYLPDQDRWLRMRPMILSVGPIAGKGEDWSISERRLGIEIAEILRGIDEESRGGVMTEALATADGLRQRAVVQSHVQQIILRDGYTNIALQNIISGYGLYIEKFPGDLEAATVAITKAKTLALKWGPYWNLRQALPAEGNVTFTLESAAQLQALADYLAKEEFREAEPASPEAGATEADSDSSTDDNVEAETEDDSKEKTKVKSKVNGKTKTKAKRPVGKDASDRPPPDGEPRRDGADPDSNEPESISLESTTAAPATPSASLNALRSRLTSRVPDYQVTCYRKQSKPASEALSKYCVELLKEPLSPPDSRLDWRNRLERGRATFTKLMEDLDGDITLDFLIAARDSLADITESLTYFGVDTEYSRYLSTFLQKCDSIARSAKIERDILLSQGTAKRVHSWTIGRNIWTVYELPMGITNTTVADYIDYSQTVSFDVDALAQTADRYRGKAIPAAVTVPVRTDTTSEDNPLVVNDKGRYVLRLTGDLTKTIVTLLLDVDNDTERDFKPAGIDDKAGHEYLWLRDSGTRCKATLMTKAGQPAELVIEYPGVEGHVPLAIPRRRFSTVRYLRDRRGNRIVKSQTAPADISEDNSTFYAMTSSAGVPLTDPSVNYRIKDSLDLDRNIMNSFLPDLMLYHPSLPTWQMYRREFLRGRPAPDWIPKLRWSVPRTAYKPDGSQ